MDGGSSATHSDGHFFHSPFHSSKATSRSTRHTTTAPRSHHSTNDYTVACANKRREHQTLHRHKAVVKHKTTLGDKFSGAMMRLKGSLTHRPGLKIAGERRMHGTDGRTTRHY